MVELLVTIAILGMVAGAVFTVYQVFQQTYTRASGLEDAQLGVRAGLDRMATELRLAGAYYTGASNAGAAITAATSTSITFLGDIDADTLSSAGAEVLLSNAAASGANQIVVDRATGFSASEYVHIANGAFREARQIVSTYTAGNTTIPLATGTTLTRAYPANSIVRSVESVTYSYDSSAKTLTRSLNAGTAEIVVDNVYGLTFTYYKTDGTTTTTTAADIYEIQIGLTTQGSDGSRRTLNSRVRPRNLGLS